MGKGLRSDPLNLFLNFYQSSKRSLTYHDVQQHIYCAAVVVASCRSLPAPPSVVQAARHRPSCRAESATLSLTQIQVSASTVGHPQLLAGQTLRQKERGVELGARSLALGPPVSRPNPSSSNRSGSIHHDGSTQPCP